LNSSETKKVGTAVTKIITQTSITWAFADDWTGSKVGAWTSRAPLRSSLRDRVPFFCGYQIASSAHTSPLLPTIAQVLA
jgi:hypothetical protein